MNKIISWSNTFVMKDIETKKLKISAWTVIGYLNIANEIGDPKASRAVGTAIGSNPIAYLIPCHRVITSSGELGGYHWGIDRKSAMIGWEAAKLVG